MKQVDVNVVCALYNNEVETVNHLMLECSFAKSCWGMVGTRNNNTTQVSFSDWALNDYNVQSNDERQMGAMLCWRIWKCRNDLVWNQKCMKVAFVQLEWLLVNGKKFKTNFSIDLGHC